MTFCDSGDRSWYYDSGLRSSLIGNPDLLGNLCVEIMRLQAGHHRLNDPCSFSLNLSGNRADPPKNANGNTSVHHARIYTAAEIQRHPDVRLTRGGLVLFALMSGGDYDDVRPPLMSYAVCG